MNDPLHPPDDPAGATAALAATRHWLERAVIGLELCPFAKAVHVKRQLRWVVSGATDEDALLDELRRELGLLAAADPAVLETTLLIHPHALREFPDYLRLLRRIDPLLRRLGHEGVLQVASFHPDYVFADADPDDPANCTNRSPYPMLHLLREASIERAVESFPDAAGIYERNIDTLRRLGHAGWRRLLDPD